MKKLKLLLILIMTAFSLNMSFSQDTDFDEDPSAKTVKIKASFSNEYQNERKNTFVKYMLKDSMGNIYAIKMGTSFFASTKNYIEKYTPDLKQVFEKELTVDNTDGKDLGFVDAMTLKGQPYIFGDYYNKEKDKRYLFAIKIDNKGVPGKPKKIAEFESEKDNGEFIIKTSKDSSKVMVVSLLPFDKKKEALSVAFTVLDNQLNLMWEGKSSIPTDKSWSLLGGSSATTVLDNFKVNANGKVFALIQIPRDKGAKEKEDSYAFYKLHIYENGVKETKKFTIDLNKKTIYSFELLETSNPEELIGTGTYSENKKIGWFGTNSGTNGTFFFKINALTGTITSRTVNPFSKKMFEFMRIDADEQKKGEGINSVRLWDYYLTDNNNVLLSMEQKYYIVTYNNIGAVRTTTTTYYSQMMFNVKYDPDGKIIYQNFIPKSLAASGTFGMYHILAPRGERHAMIFNDHRKNTEKKLETVRNLSTAKPGNDKTVARLVTIDEKGNRKISTLFSVKEEDFVLQPDVSLKYAPGVIITMAVDGRKFKLIKIEY